jgi:hypothetical protein
LQLVKNIISDTCDPLNRLPTELVIHVFDYLHPFDVWSLRRTCQRWNEQLSSTQLMRDALKRYATHHPADSALDTTNSTDSSSPSLVLELRHVLALRLARPFTYVSFPGNIARPSTLHLTRQTMSSLLLNGTKIAYIRAPPQLTESYTVVVRDLVSGSVTDVHGEARENAMNIALSTDVVAFVTFSGILYVASLLDLDASPSRVRLPSSGTAVVAAWGGTVVCHLAPSPHMIIHQHAIRRSRSFSLEPAKTAWEHADPRIKQHVFAMSVNEGRETVDVVAVVSADKFHNIGVARTHLRVVVSRFTFEGEYITQVTWEQPIPGLCGEPFFLAPLQATGERGVSSIELCYHFDQSTPEIRNKRRGRVPDDTNMPVACLALLYDEVEMSLKAVDITMATYSEFHDNLVPKLWLWKDRLYRSGLQAGHLANFSASSHSRIPHGQAYDGPHSLKRMDDLFSNFKIDDDEDDDNNNDDDSPFLESRLWHQRVQKRSKMGLGCCHDLLAMNDSFIVTVRSDKKAGDIQVACVDERVKLHGAQSTKLWDSEHSYTLPSSV